MTTGHEASHPKARSKAGPAHRRKGTRQGVGPRVLERSTARAEKIHRAAAGFVLDALGRVRRLAKPVARVRKLEDQSITATYELVRGVSREFGDLLRGRAVRRQQRPATRRQPQHEGGTVVRAKPAARSGRSTESAAMTGAH
jgi:hypothetical protein